MVSFIDWPALPSWFVVLPDTPVAGPLASLLRPHAMQKFTHPSGRPWLLGRWADEAITAATAGRAALVLIGEHDVAAEELVPVVERLARAGDSHQVDPGWAGSYHLVSTVDGQVRVEGTVSDLRRVFHARVGEVTVAADRADVLGALLDAGVDERWLAVHLLDPQTLHPLAGQPVWRGVNAVPGGHRLTLDPDGCPRQARWWSPPDPVIPMADGAAALRQALADAVRTRLAGRSLVSCDLGGLDSTAVCCLAATTRPARVVAYTAAVRDPLADDVTWAGRTVAAVGGVEHHVIPQEQMPLTYHGITELRERWDEPCPTAVDHNRWRTVIRLAAGRGSRQHLTGIGGDELLYGSTAHLHTLARRQPWAAQKLVRGFAAKYRWPLGAVWGQLLDSRSYRAWLGRVGADLTAPPPSLNEPMLDWGSPPRLPPWVTPDAVAGVRELIRAEAEAGAAEPLAPGRGQHRELAAIGLISRVTRQLQQMAAGFDMVYSAPYYDRRVMEAALAVRPRERVTPWRYKPLIVEAMRGVVPDESRLRATKANATLEEDTGLREYRKDLLGLCDDSRLAALGLVDAAAFRAACDRPLPASLQIGVLHQTVACEVWLRTLDRSTIPW